MQKLIQQVAQMVADERALFSLLHPVSQLLAKQAAQHFLYGVPMHWMNDWGTPSPLFVATASGAHFTCADHINYADFCLGDTGAMFGHSSPAVATAIAKQAQNGFTTMLPSTLAPNVGKALSEFFDFRCLAACHYRHRCQPICFTLGARSDGPKKSVGVRWLLSRDR